MSGAANWNDYQPPGGSVQLTWDILTNSNPNGAGPLVRPTWAQVFGGCIINFPYVLTVAGGALSDGFLHTVQIGGVDTLLSLSNTNLQVGGGIVYGGTIRSNISNKFSLDTAGAMSVQTLTINNLPPTDPAVSNKVYIWNGLLAISDGGTTIPSAPVVADNVLAVSATNGSDSTGARGRLDRPYKTPLAAQAAAQSGDTIVVYPGTYTGAAELGKNRVNWHLMPGVTITRTDGGNVFTDGSTGMAYAIAGAGTISNSGSPASGATLGCVSVTNSASVIHVTCDTIDCNAADTDGALNCNAVYQSAGVLHITADKIHVGGLAFAFGWGLYWVNGELDVTVRNLSVDAGYCIGCAVTATPTGDMRVRASEITGTGNQTVENNSTQAEAKLWVDALLISASDLGAIHTTGGKTYITAQKIAACTNSLDAAGGVIQCAGGVLWLRTEKLTATYGSGVLASGGTATVEAQEIEDLGHIAQAVKNTGGTLEVKGPKAILAAGDGVNHSGGTTRLVGVRLDTSAAAAKNPATVSGSGLVLDRCTLLANGSRESITAAAAKTVTNYGSVANTAKSANVTVNVQALTVDPNVV